MKGISYSCEGGRPPTQQSPRGTPTPASHSSDAPTSNPLPLFLPLSLKKYTHTHPVPASRHPTYTTLPPALDPRWAPCERNSWCKENPLPTRLLEDSARSQAGASAQRLPVRSFVRSPAPLGIRLLRGVFVTVCVFVFVCVRARARATLARLLLLLRRSFLIRLLVRSLAGGAVLNK